MGLGGFLVFCRLRRRGVLPLFCKGFADVVAGFYYRLLIRLSRGGGFGGIVWLVCRRGLEDLRTAVVGFAGSRRRLLVC